MKLIGTMLGTEDPKKLGEFYNKILGKAGWQQDGWYGYEVEGGSLMIGPHSDVKGANKEPARIMISFASSKVAEDFERIKGVGAVVVAEPYQPDMANNPGVWLATLADPDGNYIQLSTPWEA